MMVVGQSPFEESQATTKNAKRRINTMKKLRLRLRLVALTIVSLVVICFAGQQTSAQEVVASYADGVGTIIRYRISDGSEVSRIHQVYRVYATTYLPTKIAVEDSSFYYVVFGNRYLARLRASDGAILWVVDAGTTIGYTLYPVADLAVAGGNVFVTNNDFGGRIARYRATDGALIWSIQRKVQIGYLGYTPMKLAAAGNDSLFAMLGSRFLCKLSQRDGTVISQVDIPLTYSLVSWGVADLTVGGGFEFVSNQDPSGLFRKFNESGASVLQLSRIYRIGFLWYIPTKLAAVGSDPVMALLGDRYLARIRTSDGQVLWTKDISLPLGYMYISPQDIAAIGSP
jgi:outer membrane protein assembly factor BamB